MLDVKYDSSSKSFQLLHDQLGRSRVELDQCRALLEKLQVVVFFSYMQMFHAMFCSCITDSFLSGSTVIRLRRILLSGGRKK